MEIYLSLVLPCYNEAEHLEGSFVKLITTLKNYKKPLEIIFVEDHSVDSTLKILKRLKHNYENTNRFMKLIVHRNNYGRGKSVVDGIRIATGSIVGYLDIDLEIDPKYIIKSLTLFNKADVVIGHRSYAFSVLSIHRYISSKLYAWLARKLLSLPVHDSESGFKFFRRSLILPILRYVRHSGWFWDTEIIALSNIFKLRIKEIPVRYIRKKDKTSTVKTLKDSLSYLYNLSFFYLRLKIDPPN